MESKTIVIPDEAKLALEGHLKEGEQLHRRVLLDKIVDYIPKDPKLKVQIFTAELTPGGFTPWHCHNGATFFVVLQGFFEAHFEDGIHIKAKAGDCYSEPIGKVHRGHNPHPEIPNLCICWTVSSAETEFVTNYDERPW